MSDNFQVIVYGIIFFFVAGILIYVPSRWIYFKYNPEAAKSPNVDSKTFIISIFTIGALLGLFGMAVFGNKTAAVIYAVVMLVAGIYGRTLIQRGDNSGT